MVVRPGWWFVNIWNVRWRTDLNRSLSSAGASYDSCQPWTVAKPWLEDNPTTRPAPCLTPIVLFWLADILSPAGSVVHHN